MEASIAQAIVSASEDLADIDEPLTLQKDYSGRGMYGSKTTGVCGNLRSFVASVAHAATQWEGDSDEFVDGLMRLQTDSMGRSETIFY